MLIYYYVIYKGAERGLQMITLDDPDIRSITKQYDSTEMIKYNDITSKFLFSISVGGHDPWGITDMLEEDSR